MQRFVHSIRLFGSVPTCRQRLPGTVRSGKRPGLGGLRSMASQAVVIHVTAPDNKVASELSQKLIEDKLAACVQTVPGIESTYWWDGKVETSKEHLLLIKTRSALTKKVIDLVSAIHPYDVPEILSISVEAFFVDGLPSYLKWLEESTASPS